MKSPAMISITLSAVVAAALLTANTHAASCDTFKVAKLYVDGDVIRCTASTGLVPGDVPSAEVLAKVCGDSDCTAAIASIRDLDLGDCTISGVAVETQFIAPIEAYCGTTTTTGTSSSSSSGTTVTTPTPTTSSGASVNAAFAGATTGMTAVLVLVGMVVNYV